MKNKSTPRKFFGDINVDKANLRKGKNGENIIFVDVWLYPDELDHTGIVARIADSQTSEERYIDPKRNYIGVLRESVLNNQ